MEDGGQELSPESGLSLQDEAAEGQRYLEGTVEAAHEILASLDEVLGNPLLWTQPAPSSAFDASGKPGGGGLVPQQEQGWVALETGRLRYKSTSAALRAAITSIFNHPGMRLQDVDSAKEKGPAIDLHQLELRAAQLREEAAKKNQMLKLVIDQSRELVSDISMWQNAEL
ncbi:unnamed protein product [Calypogeia fissa]